MSEEFRPQPEGWQRLHERPRHQAWRWVLAALIVLVLLGAAVGGAAWLQKRNGTTASPFGVPTSAGPSPSPECTGATVRVSAAPEIAPVVEAAARTLDPSGPDPSGSSGSVCGPVSVTAEEPAAMLTSGRRPDVWIPSSSLWLTIAASQGMSFTTKGGPLARSPIVLAAPSSIGNLFVRDGKTSWAGLIDSASKRELPAVTMPDPAGSTIGLLSVYAVHQAMARTTPDSGIAQLRALTLRSRLSDADADPARTITRLAAESDGTNAVYDVGIFPTTEQQLTTYQQGGHTVSLVGAVPVDGVVDTDYPWAVSKSIADPAVVAKLRAAITTSLLTKAGFRTTATAGALTLPEEPGPVLTEAKQWAQYKTLHFNVLLLIDSSGSMNQKITDRSGKATTKAALLRQSGVSAAQLFGDDTSIGLWFFGTPTAQSPPYVEAVPIGPIGGKIGDKTRRDVLTAQMAGYKAADKSGTPLYQTVLDGEAAMRAQVKQGTVTLVIVLSDGDDGETRYTMTQQTFMSKLAAAQDPARPVPIIAVGYGGSANMTSLTAMAQATGGKAISASNPADVAAAMAQAFLAAHLQS